MAKNSPKDFIESLEKPVIIDEAQRLLELMIYILKKYNSDVFEDILSDFKHIYHLQTETAELFDKGIVLYGGDTFLKLDDNMYAMPFGFLE